MIDNRTGNRFWIAFGAISGGISVMAGAFAAHGLDPVADAARIGWLHTGSLYQALHALALLAVVGLSAQGLLSAKAAMVAKWSFTVGNVLFPAALYGLVLSGPRLLGAVAPIGGSAYILGWFAVAAAALIRRKI